MIGESQRWYSRMNARLPRTAKPWRAKGSRVFSDIAVSLHRRPRDTRRRITAPDAPQSPSERRTDLGISDIIALAGKTYDHFDSRDTLTRKAQRLANAASECIALDGDAEPARDGDSKPENIFRSQPVVESEALPEKTASSGENAIELRARPQRTESPARGHPRARGLRGRCACARSSGGA